MFYKNKCLNNKINFLSVKTKMISEPIEQDQTISTYLWDIFKDTFNGTWCGISKWYDISNLNKPMLIIPNAVYDISFVDDDNAIWKGKGLRFHDKELKFNLKRGDKWNEKFLFPGGFGGQSLIEGLSYDKPRQFHELNFFDQKCRSMIISEYTYNFNDENILGKLSSIQITPFRNANGCKIGKRKKYKSSDELLDTLNGWKGERWSYTPNDKLIYSFDDIKSIIPITFDEIDYKNKDLCKVWDDNLICGLPFEIKKGENSEFVYGCKVNDNCFKQLKIIRDKNNCILSWTFDIYNN